MPEEHRTSSGLTTRRDDRRIIQIMIFPGSNMMMVENKPCPLTFAVGDLHDLYQEFSAQLESLRLATLQHGVKLPEIVGDTHWARLADIGRAAYNTLLDDTAQNRLKELAQAEPGRWLSLTFRTPPELSFWWEMVYSGPIDTYQVGNFWGFHYPIGRAFWNSDAPDRVRLQSGIFTAIHDQLKLSKDELHQIAAHLAAAARQLGSTLTVMTLDEAVPVEELSVAQLVNLFESQDFHFGVVHFACHCDNPEHGGASEACLRLTVHKTTFEVPLLKLLKQRGKGFMNWPFVFINACHSDTSGHLLQTISFPNEMLRFRAGGVIATACAVPDNFASAFANEFYRRILKISPPTTLQSDPAALLADLGRALQETRLHFWETCHNPLGLAYGLYAVSNQELQLRN